MSKKSRKGMSRRNFLRAAAVSATAAFAQATASPLSAADFKNAAGVGSAPARIPARQGQYNESPMLRALVDAGELPPVEERLPPEPEVITPVQEVGTYGGTVRVPIGIPNQLFGDPQATLGTELVLRIDSDFSTIVSGLAESWEFNDNATEQILHLRQGLKWSDGEPFTSEDFMFGWHDVLMNEEHNPAGPPSDWRVGADRVPMEMEAIDEYTIRLTFAAPYPLIILPEAFYAGSQGGIWTPAHYGKQFHPEYADPDELQAMIDEAGFENWVQLYDDRMRVGSTIPAQVGLPGMTAFIRVADDPDHHTYERNPYYWKVDTEGNQLPYIDRAIISIIGDREVVTARLIAGELDLVGRQTELQNLPLYQSNLEAANLKLLMWNSTYPGRVIIYPNQTAKRPELREFFQNKDVRHALSLAINRDEINEVVHFGLGEPRQWAMWPNSRYYREGDETRWADFDPQQANDLLDQAGYSERDSEGFRLFPNGERVSWILQYSVDQQDVPDTLELAAEFWREIGLEANLSPISRQLLEEQIAANDIEMTVWLGDISDITWPNFPRVMLPGITNAKWGRAWELWLLGEEDNELAEEPPEEVKWVWSKWLEMRSAPTDEEHDAVAREMWDWYYDYLPAFATVGVPQAILLKQNLTNFPEEGTWGFSVIRAVPAHPEQFFFKSEV